MPNRLTRVLVSVIVSGFTVAFMLFLLGSQVRGSAGSMPGSGAVTAQTVTPTVSHVSPNEAPNNLDTAIVITGAGFQAELSGTLVLTAPSVSLGGTELMPAGWVSTSTLTATVPWGLDPGIYTVTVTNPDGGTGWLTDAVTVEEVIGVWTTAGPYGGYVENVMVNPQMTTTVYAIGTQAGLFKSVDAGEWWDRVEGSSIHVSAMALKPGTPQTLLRGGDLGLYESLDAGVSWRKLLTGSISAVAYARSSPDRVYALMYGGVRVSSDSGQSWHPPGTGLPHIDGRALVVHPVTATIAYIGDHDGRIYKTIDGGGSWQELDTGDLPNEGIFRLLIDPFSPERVYAVGGMGSNDLYHRSLDGGASWEPMDCGPGCTIIDLAFPPTLSGTVYGLTGWDILLSDDGGETWTQMVGGAPEPMLDLDLDPMSGLPLYGGGIARGVFRSDDGGMTWQEKSQGLSALQPLGLAASPRQPQQVYVTADTAGAFVSQDAGQSWSSVHMRERVAIDTAAADPSQPCVGYLGGMGPTHELTADVGFIYKTTDCGSTWVEVSLNATEGDGDLVKALAVDPHHADTVYAGVVHKVSSTHAQVGKVYRTTNGGASWEELSFGFPISSVQTIIMDPLVKDTLYVATGEDAKNQGGTFPDDFPAGHVYKSVDGGATWASKDVGLSGLPIAEMVIDPVNSSVLYTAVYERDATTDAGGVFKSTDRGETWIRQSDGLPSHNITSLAIDPLVPQTLYFGTWSNGLYHTTDGALTWQPVDGPLGDRRTILCLATSATTDRTFIYTGLAGGTTSIADTVPSVAGVQEDEILDAGIYQQTIVHRPLTARTYLPLALRRR
ncbi:MAG: VPS10 domain-containing protein [Anaerolineae bacterium]